MRFTNVSASAPERISIKMKTTIKQNLISPRTINFFPLVLVVENDDDTRLMLKYLLEIWKYRVIEATNSADAAQAAEINLPDLIIVSGTLQENDGLSIIKRMRESTMLGDTAIIYVSGFSAPFTRASVLAAGADDFLIKPIDFGLLEKTLEKSLKKDDGRNETSAEGIL